MALSSPPLPLAFAIWRCIEFIVRQFVGCVLMCYVGILQQGSDWVLPSILYTGWRELVVQEGQMDEWMETRN